jgi:hypothetical protein
VHEPWALPAAWRRKLDDPEPVVDEADGDRAFPRAHGK